MIAAVKVAPLPLNLLVPTTGITCAAAMTITVGDIGTS